ncbi:hypothetical protein [Altererythrobacter sp. ZODW24]|nr:hypothetical protein [Altererythrobacter sp. ZODW24]
MEIEIKGKHIGQITLATGVLFFAGYGVGNVAAKLFAFLAG